MPLLGFCGLELLDLFTELLHLAIGSREQSEVLWWRFDSDVFDVPELVQKEIMYELDVQKIGNAELCKLEAEVEYECDMINKDGQH